MERLGKTLWIFTGIIYSATAVAVATSGLNWPAVYIGDLFALDWRSQFNSDLGMHLALTGVWIAWRERFTPRGYVFGAFSFLWGGLFTFPYLLWALRRAQGDPRRVLLGER